jgi:hypothetical protein
MAVIANVALTNTFDTWRIRSNQGFRRLNAFAINESSLFANTLTANVSFTSKGAAALQSTATVTGLLTASGRATVGTNLTVSGNTTLGAANKTITSTGLISHTGRATISTNFVVSGNTTLGAANKTITTTGFISHTGRQTISTNLAVTGNTTLGGLATITTANAVFSGSTANPLVRITQTGTGNAFVVEDSASPDATPFVIDATGRVIVGYTVPIAIGDATPLLQTHATGSSGVTAGRWSNNVFAPYFNFGKSRGAAVGTNTIVQSGDTLGNIQFCGDDGTDLITAGALITAAVDGTPGTNDMPGRLVFSTTAAGAASVTERMRIDSAGRVGIGTTAPAATLDVVGTVSTAKANVLNQTLTDGATINWNTALGQIATVTLAGNRTMAAPTNLKVGTYILNVIQDGTGSRTITWNSVFKWTAATAPPLTTAANSRDVFSFFSDGTNLYGSFLPDVR